MTVPRKFKQIVEEFSDRPALVTSKSIISYAELDEKSNQLGNYLIEQGVIVGSVVGIMMDRSVEYILLMLAISKIGGYMLHLT
jgi:acyl-coenzyme A synthetase/AMP-(fatty) acid ligase